MKKNFKFLALAMLATATVFTSCDSDDNSKVDPDINTGGDEIVVTNGETLMAEVSGTVTIEAGASVKLDGGLHILDGGVLVIEPGVTITAQYDEANTDYIFVEQGGMIEADGGDASGLIVMTSTLAEAGAWGGIHICGKAPINTSIPSYSEIESLPYGGTDSSDNSGVLRYVRLEYTGYSYSEDQECNGVSFYGVGNGTTVEYVQAYHGSDDGFEMFGGTVDLKYCVATSCSDDSFDWTDGWCGRAQFLIAYQEADIDFKCDCLLECDNQGSNNEATPASHPVIANATLVGNTYSDSKTDGVMLKAGTEIELYNSIVVGKTYSVYVKTANTNNKLADGTSILSGNYTDTGLTNGYDVPTYDNSDFLASGNTSDYVSTLTNNYFGTIAASAPSLDSSFFEAVSYAGALSAENDWTAGWVR
ncbi:MAG: hypothetical protein SNI51_06245 [Rikenellaceae bacterium]